MKLSRNDACHCGSGKKYKKCCLSKDEQQIVSPNSGKSGQALPKQGSVSEESILATLTGEYVQPVRLCYKVYNKQAIHGKIFKNMNCMSYDKTKSRWVWLFDYEAKNLSFQKNYKDIPEKLRPIVIGSFFTDNDDEMHLDIKSPERAEHAIVFFDKYISRDIAEVTDAIILNRLVKKKEMDLLNDFDNFFKDVVIVDKGKEFDEMAEKAKDEDNPTDFFLKFIENIAGNIIPDVERIRTNYYEDGIASFKYSLQIQKTIAMNKFNGKEMTNNDVIKLIASSYK